MLNSGDLLQAAASQGIEMVIDHQSSFMVVARLTILEQTFLVRVGTDRITIWSGDRKIQQIAGKSRAWLDTFKHALVNIRSFAEGDALEPIQLLA